MKRFLAAVLAIKVNGCLVFSAGMVMFTALEFFLEIPMLQPGRVVQMLVLAMICGILQYVLYSGRVVTRMGAFGRGACFALGLFAAAAVFAVVFRWFPVGHWTAWALFFGIFLATLLSIGAGFEIMFRVTGHRYTSLLNEAQNQK